MSFRRSTFDVVGGFNTGIGRVGRTPLGCEETEFSIRARKAFADGRVLHVPEAVVEHRVGSSRTKWSYFCSRCWSEGVSKAIVAEEVDSDDALSAERTYTLMTLPKGILRGVFDALRGDASGLQRATAIVFGLTATTLGYLHGWLVSR
jgi:hypothetical protein